MLQVLQNPKNRTAVVASLIVVVVLCIAWIVYSLTSSAADSTVNAPPTDPVVLEGIDLTAKLHEDDAFAHLEVVKTPEGKWYCAGQVKTTAAMNAAKAKCQELKPDAEWIFEIVPLNP